VEGTRATCVKAGWTGSKPPCCIQKGEQSSIFANRLNFFNEEKCMINKEMHMYVHESRSDIGKSLSMCNAHAAVEIR
jgi:hypothetical protein